MAIELEVGAHLLKVNGRITGKDRKVTLVDSHDDGTAVESERRIEEKIHDKVEWKEANSLLNHLRSQCKRFGVNVEPIGFLADAIRAGEFREAVAEALAQIRTHNRTARYHRVVGPLVRQAEPVVLCAPIGTALNAAMAHQLYDTVEASLQELKALVFAGAVAPGAGGIPYWIQRNRSLPGLMPSIIASAVADAVNDAPRLLKELREAKENNADLSVVGPTLDVSLIDTALALVAANPAVPE